MITDADIEKLKQVFVTKEDLLGMEKRLDAKFASKEDLSNSISDAVVKVFDYIEEVRQDLKKEIKDVKNIVSTISVEMRSNRIILSEHEARIQALENP